MRCDVADAVRAHKVENSTEAACAGTDYLGQRRPLM